MIKRARHERGAYRSILVVLLDGKDFRKLHANERWTLVCLKLTLGPCQLGVIDGLEHVLAAKTGLTPRVVAKALTKLEAEGWIKRRDNIAWVIEGLRYEPSFSANDDKHHIAVQRFVDTLPRHPLVAEFINHYSAFFTDGPTDAPKEGPTHGPPLGPNGGPGVAQIQIQKTDTEEGRQKREEGSTTGDADFETAWALYPKRAGSNSRQDALKAWNARKRTGVKPSDMIAGVERYAAFIRATGKERTEWVKQASTFFGPGEHWTADWAPPASAISEHERFAVGAAQ